MNEPIQKLKKLRGRGLDELRVRGQQKLSAWTERRGWSSQTRVPDDAQFRQLLAVDSEDLLRDFKTGTTTFFPSFRDQHKTVEVLKNRWSENARLVIHEADQIRNGRFNLLGLRGVSFGDPIDWHLEPVANKRSPLVHWSRLGELDAQETGDKKIVWELNRHQYFLTLGRAYWLTGDERYADTFATHVTSWMENNPPTLGINWLSSLEVAFRSISWIWALQYFKDAPQLTSTILTRMLKFLYLHARHLEKYLSTYSSPNTHLTGEALGLYYLGRTFTQFRESARWREIGKRILLEALPLHVRPDGVYFEQSSYYQRYTVDFYTHFYVLEQEELAAKVVEEKLQLLLDHLMYITRPDGTSPMFGDDDGGKLLSFDARTRNDFRPALSNAAALFMRCDYKYVAGEIAEETLWLLGAERVMALDRMEAKRPAKQSVAFPDGGYYVMRDGWERDSNYLLFDCGPHGANNCGHAHADALSFELAVSGETMLVDPGTYTYTGAKDLRDWFRNSRAHNTLTIDGESSSVSAGPFSWSSMAQCQTSTWIDKTNFNYVVASHDGYGRLQDPATHRRSVLFIKNGYWIIRDQVKSKEDHALQVLFHFAPSIDARAKPHRLRAVDECTNKVLEIFTLGDHGEWSRERGWVSSCYGEMEEAPVCAFSLRAKGPAELITFLLPGLVNSDVQPSLREIEAIGGRAFEIDFGGQHDILVIRGFSAGESDTVETARLITDFEITWARFSGSDARTPDELVLIGGQSLELEGREILKSTRRMSSLAVRRIGDQVSVETDEGALDLSLPGTDLGSFFSSSVWQAEIGKRRS